MSCAAGPDIKEDGLVLALDAANTKSILSAVEVLVVAGGGGGGSDMGGGGGGGGVLYSSAVSITPGSAITATVGAGGAGAPAGVGQIKGSNGTNSSFGSFLISIGGGGGASCHDRSTSPAGDGGSGGGASGGGTLPSGGQGSGGYGGGIRGLGTAGQGNSGGTGIYAWYPGGGGGAGAAGSTAPAKGGDGLEYNITGVSYFWAGGGGGSGYSGNGGDGGKGGGGGGAVGTTVGGSGLNNGSPGGGGSTNSQTNTPGGNAGANTGGGGGGGSHYSVNNYGGDGGSGIVIVRYPGSQRATGGTITSVAGHTIHTFTTSGTFTPNFGDMSNNGNTGTLTNGPTYSSANGGSLVFDGTDDVVNSTTSIIDRADGQEITVSCWIKPSRTSGQYSVFCTNRSNDTGTYNWIFYQHTTDGAIAFHGDAQNKSSYVPTTNVWINVTNTVTASGVSTLYVNGVSTYTVTGYTYGNGTPSRLGIGADPGGQEPFQGNISQVSIYNRALSAAEIQQNYNALKGRFTPDGSLSNPFLSPVQAQSLAISAGNYYFKSGAMSSAQLLEYQPNYYESKPFCCVFRSPYRSTATTNRIDLNIPMGGLLVQRDALDLRGAVYWSTPITYNSVGGAGNNTADSGTGYAGSNTRRVILGGSGGHGIFATNQQQCNWGSATGAIGAGWDGSTCGSFPNDLVWGTGRSDTATYENRSGTWSHWITWN